MGTLSPARVRCPVSPRRASPQATQLLPAAFAPSSCRSLLQDETQGDVPCSPGLIPAGPAPSPCPGTACSLKTSRSHRLPSPCHWPAMQEDERKCHPWLRAGQQGRSPAVTSGSHGGGSGPRAWSGAEPHLPSAGVGPVGPRNSRHLTPARGGGSCGQLCPARRQAVPLGLRCPGLPALSLLPRLPALSLSPPPGRPASPGPRAVQPAADPTSAITDPSRRVLLSIVLVRDFDDSGRKMRKSPQYQPSLRLLLLATSLQRWSKTCGEGSSSLRVRTRTEFWAAVMGPL